MPILKNPRHERFAQALAKGMTADEAYQEAGYKPSRPNASRLRAIENVSARIVEIQGKAANRAELTIERLIAYLEEARAIALASSQPGAVVSAVKEMGILTGLRVERRENTRKTIADLDDAELAAIAGEGRQGEILN
jgi:phage terminase small subunit